MKKKISYSVDIDTIDDDQIRDLEFKSYDKAKKIYDKFVAKQSYEEIAIDNIQLVEIVDNNWTTLECKFFDNELG
jgi:hypothetical protein